MSGGTSHRKQYLVIAAVLTVLTLIEVGVVYTPISRGLIIFLLIALAVTKAMFVALYYMHLKFETKYLKMVIGLPMLFPPVYAVVLMLEAVWHAAFYR